MNHERRPHVDRPAEPRGRRGVVDDERDASVVGDARERGDVGDVAARIGDRFTEDRPGVAVDGCADRVLVLGVDETGGPAEAADRLAELRDGAAIEPGGGDEVAPRPHQRKQRQDLRRVPRGAADGADSAFQRRHPLPQHGNGGVRQPRIDEPDLLEVEERRGVVGVAEHIGGGLVDRRLARAGRRVGPAPGMDLQRVEAVVLGLGHDRPPFR